MFVLMFYDVGEKRVGKVLKTARRYLTWIQNSVLEGELTPASMAALKVDVHKVLDNMTACYSTCGARSVTCRARSLAWSGERRTFWYSRRQWAGANRKSSPRKLTIT